MSNLPLALHQVMTEVSIAFLFLDTQLLTRVSDPFYKHGKWIVDFVLGEKTVVLTYSANTGFGISYSPSADDFSSSPDETVLRGEEASDKIIQGLTRCTRGS